MRYAVSPRTRKIKKKLKASTPVMFKRSERFLPALSDLSPRNTPMNALIASRKKRARNRQIRTVSPKGYKQRMTQRENLRLGHKINRTIKAKRPSNKKCGKGGLSVRLPLDKVQSYSMNDANSTDLFAEGSLSKPLTVDRTPLRFHSDKNNTNKAQLKQNCSDGSKKISKMTEDANRAKLISSECSKDNQTRSSLSNMTYVGKYEQDLKDLIEMLQVEMRRYQAAIELQSDLSLLWENEDVTQNFQSIEKETVVERLQSTISKYRAFVSNITHQLLCITSRSQESEELSKQAIEVANSTIDQKNSLIANLVRKQMQDAKELTRMTNSLISNSEQDFERKVRLINAKCSSDKNKMLLLKERNKTRTNDLEVWLQKRDSESGHLQTDCSRLNEGVEMMKKNQSIPTQKKILSHIGQVCTNAGMLNKRIQRKVMRSLIRYVDHVDQQVTSDGQSLMSELLDKKEKAVAQEVLLSREEGLLKKELVKLSTISQSNSGLNNTEQSLLLNTMDDIVEACDLLKNCIWALGKRTIRHHKEIMSIQCDQTTSHVEESSEIGNYIGISSPMEAKGKGSLSIIPVSSEINQQSPIYENASKMDALGENWREGDKRSVFRTKQLDKRIGESNTSFHSDLPQQLATFRKIEEAEGRPLAISELGEKGVCFMPSDQQIYSDSSVSRRESLIRSPKFDISLSPHSHLEFGEKFHKAAKTTDMKKVRNAIVTTKPSTIKDEDSEFPIQSDNVIVDTGTSNSQVEPLEYTSRNTIKAQGAIGGFEEYRSFDLSYLLGNCSTSNQHDLSGRPPQIFLQNTLSDAKARSWTYCKAFSSSNGDMKEQILTQQAPKKLRTGRYRRLSVKMESRDFLPNAPPYIVSNKGEKQEVKLPNSFGNLKITADTELSKKRSIESGQHTADDLNLSTAGKGINRWNASLSTKTPESKSERDPKKAQIKRRFSIHRGWLTKELANVHFNYADLIFNQLSDWHSIISKDEEEIRLVIVVSRAKMLLKKLEDLINNNVTKEYSQLSGLIYDGLRDFNSVIPEDDDDVNIIIAAARGKVLKLVKQKMIVNSPQRRIHKSTLSISFTYKKHDRRSITVSEDDLHTGKFKSNPIFRYSH